VTPPRRRAVEAHQARRLRGNAVGRHELLLLPDRAQEAERVQAEAEHRQQAQREQAEDRGAAGAQPLAPVPRAEDHERQHERGAQLHPDAGDERGHACARTRGRARRERERARQRRQQERVVVRAADRQHQQHRVESDERRRRRGRTSQARGGARAQGDGAEARARGDAFEEPQPAGHSHRRAHVAQEREQRPVGGVLKGPADEREDGVARRFGGHVRVGVQAVQHAHAREREIAEHVLGDQRRSQREEQVRGHDRASERQRRKAGGAHEHEQIAGAGEQHQCLEGAGRQARAQARQRARLPVRPAAAATRHVLRGRRRGVEGDQQ
jgi:hypothetical protein